MPPILSQSLRPMESKVLRQRWIWGWRSGESKHGPKDDSALYDSTLLSRALARTRSSRRTSTGQSKVLYHLQFTTYAVYEAQAVRAGFPRLGPTASAALKNHKLVDRRLVACMTLEQGRGYLRGSVLGLRSPSLIVTMTNKPP